MELPPNFLLNHEKVDEEEIFQPPQSPRKGELIAWGSAVAIALALGIFYVLTQTVQCLTAGLLLFFLISGGLISFGIWIDTRTSIRVSREGVRYKNPFKEVELGWDKVNSVHAAKAGSVWKIAVTGMDQYFTLRVSESPEGKDSPRAFLVIPNGDRLVRIICGNAKLSDPKLIGEDWVCKNPKFQS
jgi:hypothetical protein